MLGRHYFTSWASCLQYPLKNDCYPEVGRALCSFTSNCSQLFMYKTQSDISCKSANPYSHQKFNTFISVSAYQIAEETLSCRNPSLYQFLILRCLQHLVAVAIYSLACRLPGQVTLFNRCQCAFESFQSIKQESPLDCFNFFVSALVNIFYL